ncbi:Rho GTPase-activating protein 19 [Dissostichus eleginoides]|uniref:Rho GTPase-activating protein 19 n=1 Tax=Dissostichus eleginoides TaxID=100907 RepID=A0AAD9EYR1_DISEL|nr:Rho GTPase-activating protein 19 [Dissostichus eleginoides]
MAAGKDVDENTQNRRGPVSSMVINHEESPGGSHPSRPPVIFNPDFFVEKLRHENPDIFLELVLSNITRLIDLPGTEFAQLLGEEGPKTPTGGNGGFFRSFNFLKRKDKGVVFGTPLTEICIAQIYQLIEYLSKNLHLEGLFRVPGNSVRQQTLKELLNSGVDVDLESGDFHPNDVATLLKTFLGELPEPLLTQRHFHAHLKIADLTLFDELGNKTALPNKERQIEALQLLFLLLPQANRALLKLLLDLLYHTARQQDKNKMSAFNLALMFAPHVVWPRHMTACDLKDNLKKLNNSMAFLIKHSQKLFRAPVYLREYARMHFTGTKALQTKDDLELFAASRSPAQRTTRQPQHARLRQEEETRQTVSQTDNLRDAYQRLPSGPPTAGKKHPRSRSFGGLIKRKARGEQLTGERRLRQVSPDIDSKSGRKAGKENVILQAVNSPLNGHMLGKVGLVVKNPDFAFKDRVLKVSKQNTPSVTRMCFSPAQEISL